MTPKSPPASASRVPVLSPVWTRLIPSAHAIPPFLNFLPLEKKNLMDLECTKLTKLYPWFMIYFYYWSMHGPATYLPIPLPVLYITFKKQ